MARHPPPSTATQKSKQCVIFDIVKDDIGQIKLIVSNVQLRLMQQTEKQEHTLIKALPRPHTHAHTYMYAPYGDMAISMKYNLQVRTTDLKLYGRHCWTRGLYIGDTLFVCIN